MGRTSGQAELIAKYFFTNSPTSQACGSRCPYTWQVNRVNDKTILSFPGLEETVTVELDVTAVMFAVETADMPAVVCPLLVDSVVLSDVVPSRRREASVSV